MSHKYLREVSLSLEVDELSTFEVRLTGKEAERAQRNAYARGMSIESYLQKNLRQFFANETIRRHECTKKGEPYEPPNGYKIFQAIIEDEQIAASPAIGRIHEAKERTFL